MRKIKFKVFIKELHRICEVKTLTFGDKGVWCFIKGNNRRNYFIDGVDNVLLCAGLDKDSEEIFEVDGSGD